MKEACCFSSSMCMGAVPRLAFRREKMSSRMLLTNRHVVSYIRKSFEKKRPNRRFFRTNALDTVWRRTSPAVCSLVPLCIWPTPQGYLNTCATHVSLRRLVRCFTNTLQRFIPYPSYRFIPHMVQNQIMVA